MTRTNQFTLWVLGAVVLASSATASLAKNVDLVTLPARDSVQLTIYNSEDITLVKETRYVTLKKGVNKLQFSWANTLIDPTSVTFRPLDHKGDVELLDTVFPGQKPQHLIWNVESAFEGQVKVEVTYFTSGLTWKMDYVAITDPDDQGSGTFSLGDLFRSELKPSTLKWLGAHEMVAVTQFQPQARTNRDPIPMPPLPRRDGRPCRPGWAA